MGQIFNRLSILRYHDYSDYQDKGLDGKVLIHLDNFKTNPTHNTDNKGYKTCHGFCKAFLHSREHSIRGHHRDGAATLNQTRVR